MYFKTIRAHSLNPAGCQCSQVQGLGKQALLLYAPYLVGRMAVGKALMGDLKVVGMGMVRAEGAGEQPEGLKVAGMGLAWEEVKEGTDLEKKSEGKWACTRNRSWPY